MTTKRRRYMFADRAEAEAAYNRANDGRARAEWAVEAAVSGELRWFKGDHFWIGRWAPGRYDGGLFVVRFMAHGWDNQKPNSSVMTPDDAAKLRRSQSDYSSDEARELVRLLDEATAHQG